MFAQESVMDVEKEREAFEAYMAEKYKNLRDRRQCLNNGGGYMAWDMNVAWQVWQAATAQAVPEGFVVLKISDVREILSNASDAMDAESPSSVFTQTGIPSTWYDHHLVAEKNILDAIKAQEQVG